MTPDTGASSEYGKEDEMTMAVGTELMDLLRNAGYQVVDVLPKKVSSVKDSLQQRIDKANAENVDLFVSVHFNAFKDCNANGVEVFTYDGDSELVELGNNILDEFTQYKFKSRGVKNGNYLVLRDAIVPAVLVECGFLTSETDMARYEPFNMAENIFNAIERSFKNVN